MLGSGGGCKKELGSKVNVELTEIKCGKEKNKEFTGRRLKHPLSCRNMLFTLQARILMYRVSDIV